MANLRDIRRRIKSVKNTAQITKAMQMVAASKMRKAQQAALNGRDYAQLLNRVIVALRDSVDSSLHPLLERREVKNELVVVMTTDKGLCGALNTNVLRNTRQTSRHRGKPPTLQTYVALQWVRILQKLHEESQRIPMLCNWFYAS
jgi:F-type H+-transporting ATPase subunit gamma